VRFALQERKNAEPLQFVHEVTWGGRPRPRRTPWSGSRIAQETEADGGVGRGPGGPPHFVNSSIDFTNTTLDGASPGRVRE
jgi:hypothetical protein